MQIAILDKRHRINEDGELEKFCPRCEDWWPADPEFFHRCSSNPDGLHSWCKACHEDYRYKKGTRPTGVSKNIDPFRELLFGETVEDLAPALWMQCDLRL